MTDISRGQVWASGSAYEPYVGRWSRLGAQEFLKWLAVPVGATWLDVGSGTGALTRTILAESQPRYVIAADSSAGYVEYLQQQVSDARICFEVSDARDLHFKDESYDATVSGLVLNFVPEPEKAVAEMARVTRRGGVVAAYVWDYAGETQLMRHFWNAAGELDPAARELDEGLRFKICQPEPLAALFSQSRLKDVETRAVDVPTVFRDFDDYWSPFLGGQGPAPSYAMSLSEERRVALCEKIRAKLPVADDGSIHLMARAWAVRGSR